MSANITIRATVSSASNPTYYVKNGGDDGADGLSDSTAWATINKVNTSSFNPGDSVLFKAGDTWRETLIVPSSGNSSAYITFGAYGDIPGGLPFLNGSSILSSWTNEGSNVWSNDCPVYDDLGLFLHDVHYTCVTTDLNTLFTQVDTLGSVTSASTYFIDDAVSPSRIYVYSTTNPLSTLQVSARMFGGYIGGKTYVKIENIAFGCAAHTGLFLHATTGTTFAGHNLVSHCEFSYNRESGVYIDNGYSYNTVEYCGSEYNGNGYYIWSDDEVNCNTSNNIYSHNVSGSNIAYAVTGAATDGHGFGIYNSTDNIIEYNESNADKYGINIDIAGHSNNITIRGNYIHDTQTASPAIQIGGEAASFTHNVYYNLIVNCADGSDGMPILILGSTRTGTINIYNNTIYQDNSAGKSTWGIYAAKGTNLNIKNNILYNNQAVPVLIVIVSAGAGTVINNNLYWAPSLTYARFYQAGYINGIAAWQAAGYDANGVYDNPDFTTDGSVFTLQVGSPAINTGTDVSLTADILGNPMNGNPDMGCYEKQ